MVADETRPLLQGSRLTAWELTQAGVPVTLIADGMAASRLRRGDVACVIVGADRIAANGDVANKIGTYGLALAARAHGIPFYVAAPSSTIDRGHAGRRAHSDRGAECRRGDRLAGHPNCARGHRGLESGVRRDPGRVGHRRSSPIAACLHRSARRTPDLMPSILALDQGTTGSTALVVHQDGSVLGRGYREFTQYFPQPGWVEHDPEEIFRVSVAAMREALAASGERPAGIGITNQRETVVLWDRRTLAPVAPAIVWQDRRTARALPRAARGGMRAAARASAPASWPTPTSRPPSSNGCCAIRHSAAAPSRGELAAGTIESWLVAKLTGGRVHVTDQTNASRTMLYDLRTRDWRPELLQLLQRAARDVAGDRAVGRRGRRDRPGAPRPSAPDCRGRGRSAGCALRPGLLAAGLAKNTYGTGAFLLVHAGDEVPVAAARAARDRGVRRPGRAGLRAGGERLHCRRGRPVAAGRSGGHCRRG